MPRRHAMWEFPKIGDPKIVPRNCRILIIRTPKKFGRYPLFSETPMYQVTGGAAGVKEAEKWKDRQGQNPVSCNLLTFFTIGIGVLMFLSS